jgi:uncharacterized membrane protein
MEQALTSNQKRITSIDLLRGLVMIIMALDHVRDYFHAGAYLYDPLDLEKTSTALFFTRWITISVHRYLCFLPALRHSLSGKKNQRKSYRFFF